MRGEPSVLLVVLITCGAGGLEAQRLQIPGRLCDLQPASQVPALASVFDSTAGLSALASLPSAIGGQAMITLTFSPEGQAGRARVLSTDLPDSSAAVVLRLVAGAVRDLAVPGLPGTRLLVSVGVPPSVRVEPAVYCPAESVPGPGDRGVGEIAITSSGPGPTKIKSPRMRILVSGSGAVQRVDLEESSGLDDLDHKIMDRVRQGRFKPALLDGVPVSAWIRQP